MTQSKIERVLVNVLPNIQDFVFIVIFISVFVLGTRMMNIDGDLGRHLTIGTYILDHRQIPTQDIFSHTKPGDPLTPHEWLAQVTFAGFYRVFGLSGVVFAAALALALTYAFLFRLSLRCGAGALSAMLYTFSAAAASSLHWLTRPHIFTIFFLVVWVILLENLRMGRTKRWWYLPLIMLLWVNVHGAFIAGFVSLGLYAIGEGWDFLQNHKKPLGNSKPFFQYMLFGAGTALLTTLINPVGVEIWETSIGFLQNQYLVSHTAEYFSPNFQDPSTWPFFLILLGSILYLGLRRRPIPSAYIFLFTGWAAMALYSTRNIPLFTVAAAPAVASLLIEFSSGKFMRQYQQLSQAIEKTNQQLRGSVLPGLIVVLAAMGMILAPVWFASRYIFSPEVFPVAAADWVADNPPMGKMFNYFPWGGYLLYRAWPEQAVFIDGQTDFYGEALTREYESVLTVANNWQEILAKYNVEWVIMPAGSKLIEALNATGDWAQIYQDETAVILRRGS